MFYALPAETVFEAKERTRRATFYLFILLVFLYIFFADLLVAAVCLMSNLWMEMHAQRWTGDAPFDILEPVAISTLAAAVLAVAHFLAVRHKSLDDMLAQIQARPADEKDRYHRAFIHVVQEAEAATGIHGIRAVVLSNPGCNAFSLQDGKGRAVIGVTEGLLSKLSRAEISAVVAHEAAHLVHEDSRLVTTACFLFAVFGQVNRGLGLAMRGSNYSTYDRRSSSRG
ncbi:MAG TPA: M48 family metalloprotease, partial [bacterium]|nr:M48 family metalloprotease [bacterium]